jgi:colanic acid biosynthesis glycosyl transferase WcaI
VCERVRVLVLAQWYSPDPLPKPHEIAEDLAQRGHHVTVITGLPNYPSGSLAPGYRLVPWMRETIRGIPVIRVFELPYRGRSVTRRGLDHLSFSAAAAIAGLAVPRPDIVYTFLPPPTLGMSAALIRARGAPFVADVQDIWPDEAIMAGLLREGLAASAVRWVERYVYARASHLLVPTTGARNNLMGKGVPAGKITVMPHWYPGEAVVDPAKVDLRAARSDLAAGDRFTVTFAGNLGILQGLSTVLEAAEILRARDDIAFRFIGDGADRRRLEEVADRRGLANVRFLSRRTQAEVAPLLAASDCLLVHAAPGPLNHLILPTKALAYLAAGRPVIAAMEGATAELVEEAGAGTTTAPGDAKGLADAIVLMAGLPEAARAEMGSRGRRFALEHFDKRRIMDRIEEVLRTHARLARSPSA